MAEDATVEVYEFTDADVRSLSELANEADSDYWWD